MCKSRIWLLTCFNTFSFCLSSTHFLYLHLIFISLYHILSLHIFHNISVVISLMILVSNYYVAHVKVSTLKPMISFKILLQLLCRKVELMYKERLSTFSPPYTKMNEYCDHWKQFSNLGGHCHCWSDSYRFGATCFDNDITCNNSCHSRQGSSYTNRKLRDDFIPFAIETYGCLHPCFHSLFTSYVHVNITCH
jgi:hypothetical protein